MSKRMMMMGRIFGNNFSIINKRDSTIFPLLFFSFFFLSPLATVFFSSPLFILFSLLLYFPYFMLSLLSEYSRAAATANAIEEICGAFSM